MVEENNFENSKWPTSSGAIPGLSLKATYVEKKTNTARMRKNNHLVNFVDL
jgi:hypothetical protein